MLGRRGLASEVPLEQSKLERRLAARVRRRSRFEQLQRLVVIAARRLKTRQHSRAVGIAGRPRFGQRLGLRPPALADNRRACWMNVSGA